MASPLHRAGPVSAATSCCSDLREINDAKVQNILSYLEDVVPAAVGNGLSPCPSLRQSLAQERDSFSAGIFADPSSIDEAMLASSARRGGGTSIVSGITTIAGENSTQVYHGIKGKIDALRQTCDSLKEENAKLVQKMSAEKQRSEQRISRMHDIAKQELDALRTELQGSQRKHAEVVSKLVHEKSQLSASVDDLSKKLEGMLDSQSRTVERLEAAHAAAITQLKSKWMAQEKAAREKWKEQEAKEIKRSTLSALEPDLELLMTRHKKEKTRLAEELTEQLRRKDELIAAKEAQYEDMKMKCSRVAEERIMTERRFAEERAREECERMRRQLDEERQLAQKKREGAEVFFQEQKETMMREMKSLEQQLFDMRRQASEGTAAFRDAVAEEVRKITEANEEQMRLEKLRFAEEQTAARQRLFEENLSLLATKEAEIQRLCNLERDKQIAKVVQQLESEHIAIMSSSRDAERMVREKIVRMEREIERLQTDLELRGDQLKICQSNLRTRDEELTRCQRELRSAREALDSARESCEKEFDGRLRFLDGEWQQKLRRFEIQHVDEINRLQHEHQLASREWDRQRQELEGEYRSMEQKHSSELSAINDRVLVAVAKKEATIQHLHEQVRQYEGIVRDQEAALQKHKSLLSQ
jgi:DNA repair exonuclease SbcCD ATPase subunit